MKFLKVLLSLVIIAGIAVALYSFDLRDISDGINERLSLTPLKSENNTNNEQVYFYDVGTVLPEVPFYSDVNSDFPKEITGHWYDNMNEKQKQYYRLILSAFEDMSDSFFEISKNDEDYKNNINIAYNGVLADNPDIFWQDNTYRLKLKDDSCFIKLGYCMAPAERDQKRAELEQKLDELLALTKNMTEFEKEAFFYNHLCQSTDYCENENTQKYTAYGALCEGSAVCEGYSKAMQLLCKNAGIECLLVRGVTDGKQHIWNVVKLSDGWYELDVTQSDRKNATPNLFYFNATSDDISITHNRLPDLKDSKSNDYSSLFYNFNLPLCTSVLYNRDTAQNLYEYTP